jgi:hypothetical protein
MLKADVRPSLDACRNLTMNLYTDLLKRILLSTLVPDERYVPGNTSDPLPFDHELRVEGKDWPTRAFTMVGQKRLDILEYLLDWLIEHRILADIVECGVWRGGASIFMRGVLVSKGAAHLRSWLYDSFAGLPKPNLAGDCDLSIYNNYLAVPLNQVQENFVRFGLWSDKVKMVPGWFNDTLPQAEVRRISLLRLDGDMYESTIVALESLYAKVVRGGFVVIDDYGAIEVCKQATDDFRKKYNIGAPMTQVDWTCWYWQKT